MTTHTWNSNAAGPLYDPTHYVHGQPFEPGDTLVFDGGSPEAAGILESGTYLFNGSGGNNSLDLADASLDGSSRIVESGGSLFALNSFGEFVNDGNLEAGTTAAAGSVELVANPNGAEAAAVTNNGQITVQNESLLRIFPNSPTDVVNAAGGTITITDGSELIFGNADGYTQGYGNSLVNDGLITVTGPYGRGSNIQIAASYGGSGTLLVQGTAGANPTLCYAGFGGAAEGNFDVASGELQFGGEGPIQGTINFGDNDGLVNLLTSAAYPGTTPFLPLQATFNHFEAGDQIYLDGSVVWQSYRYDPTSHDLALYAGSNGQGSVVAQVTLAGDYTTGDFQLTAPASVDGISPAAIYTVLINTTSSANGTLYVAPGGSFSGDNGNPILITKGSATITTGTGASTVYLAGGDNRVVAQGDDTVVSSTGNDLVFASGAVHDYAGNAGSLTVVSDGVSTVTGGGEAMTVFGGSGSGGVVYGGNGLAEFIGGSGRSDFVGGQGAEIAFGGSGGGSISGGGAGGFIYGADAPTTISGGAGDSTITAANGNTVVLTGAASNLVAAGTGNVTLIGGASTGNNSVFGGSGTDLLAGGAGDDFFMAGAGAATMTGGGGANLFAFDDGSTGGSVVITDLQNGIDHLTLQNYGSNAVAAALGSATVSGGSTFLSLQDGTHITLTGLTDLRAASFI